MSMKKSSDTIENQTSDIPVCSGVPQPLRHRVPPLRKVMHKNYGKFQVVVKSVLLSTQERNEICYNTFSAT
jgi:hypothetical protein